MMSPDTKVRVLCVHHFETIGLKTLYFKTGRKLAHTDLTRYIPVHTMQPSLSLNERNILSSILHHWL